MTRRPRVAVVAVGVTAVLVAGGCRQPDRLDMERATRHIAASLVAEYGRKVTATECPAKVEVEVGRSFVCTTRISGQPLTVRVTQRTEDGDLQVEPTAAVLEMTKVRTDLKATLADQFGKTNLRSGCGAATLRIVEPGGSFDCKVTDGTSTKIVTVTVRDAKGSLTYRLH